MSGFPDFRMRVLVTGATGFIGREIVSRLAADQSGAHRITGLARNVGTAADPNIELVRGDITDPNDVARLESLGPFDAVIHSAGLAHQFGDTPDLDFNKTNVEGTQNVVDLARRVQSGHFILISSTAVYGIREGAIDEDSECRPETPYARSKFEAERICRETCERGNIPLTIFRLAPVLGEKGVGNVPRLISAIDRGRFVWLGNGENRKALIYVGDVADACLRLLRQKRGATEVFNLAADPISMAELVDTISATLGKSVPRLHVPAALPRLVLGLNSRTARLRRLERVSRTLEKWLCDDLFLVEKIEKAYGFQPATSIEEAVRIECRWFLKHGNPRAAEHA